MLKSKDNKGAFLYNGTVGEKRKHLNKVGSCYIEEDREVQAISEVNPNILRLPGNALFLWIVNLLLLITGLIIIDASILVLLIFRDQVVHIRLSLCKLHLIHPLISVPM